jgi:hypothetical protein
MLNKIKKTHILLFIFICFAAIIRFAWLGTMPKGVLVDEMHYGYLAWSILETGKDEHGVSYPLIFKAFGDDKLPGQVYTLVPFVKSLGLSNTTIKIPSGLAGVLLVAVMYFVSSFVTSKTYLRLFASLMVAIMPWSIVLSRHGFESNIALLFFGMSLYFIFKWLSEDGGSSSRFLNPILTAISLAVTWYFYIAYRPITLLILALLTTIFSLRYLLHSDKKSISTKYVARFLPLLVSLSTFLILISPFLLPNQLSSNQTRLNQVGLFSNETVKNIVDENRTFCTEVFSQKPCYVLWNKVSVVGFTVAQRWLHTYSPNFLATADSQELGYLNFQYTGQLLILQYPLFLIGFIITVLKSFEQLLLLRKTKISTNFKKSNDIFLVVLLLLIVGPIPAILVGEPQPVRMSVLIPVVILCIIIGTNWLTEFLKRSIQHTHLVFSVLSIIVFGMTVQLILFLTQLYAIHPLKNELSYDSHLPALFSFIQRYQEDNPDSNLYIKPIISDPIMYYAYYTQLHPKQYQETVVLGELEESGFQHAVALQNVFVTDSSPEELFCINTDKNKSNIFVTNEKLTIPILFEAQSHHKVHTFAYVYDLNIPPIKYDCSHYEQVEVSYE